MIRQTVSDDWQVRPFPFKSGPGWKNVAGMTDFVSTYIPDLKHERKLSLLCGDKAVVVSKVTGTVQVHLVLFVLSKG